MSVDLDEDVNSRSMENHGHEGDDNEVEANGDMQVLRW